MRCAAVIHGFLAAIYTRHMEGQWGQGLRGGGEGEERGSVEGCVEEVSCRGNGWIAMQRKSGEEMLG